MISSCACLNSEFHLGHIWLKAHCPISQACGVLHSVCHSEARRQRFGQTLLLGYLSLRGLFGRGRCKLVDGRVLHAATLVAKIVDCWCRLQQRQAAGKQASGARGSNGSQEQLPPRQLARPKHLSKTQWLSAVGPTFLTGLTLIPPAVSAISLG